ncbi:MAG TPA: formylglycine-generating enzyme family protein [Anaerolineales bacterium]|nr:formylglycine-generating enzyme family protein [Anaerolineales bacterium]
MTRLIQRLLALSLVLTFGAACGTPSTPIVHPATLLPPDTPAATATQAASPTSADTPTPAATPTLAAGATRTSTLDGMLLVYVPAGPFQMGSADSDGQAYSIEKPQHTVTLPAFWIDQTEVTNAEYALCVQAGACKPPLRYTSNSHDDYYRNAQYADYPVIWVNWAAAQAYCQWAGGRLPTEAEWEKAARGTDGRIYPWGNNPPDDTLANFGTHIEDVTAVDKYPAGASFYGALDMAGNVWDWTADWFGDNYYSQSPALNPTGPESGTRRVLRGGSWTFNAVAMRAAYRYGRAPDYSSAEVSFRCVVDAQP